MELLIPMAFGLLIARFLSGEKVKKIVDLLQMLTTLLLIFSMGYSLGSRENFLSEISSIGFLSLLYAVVPVVFSVLFVFVASSIYLKRKKKKEGR